MSTEPARAPRSNLLRATLTLLAGGAMAQALPLLLGPWLTRLYSPQAFGEFHLFWAVASNIAVVACARYEFALPLVGDNAEAAALRRLCGRILWVVVALSAVGAVLWWQLDAPRRDWRLWLPAAVGALGAVSLASLWATRQQCFQALAAARVLQHGGASVAQVLAGLGHFGVHGLVVAPILTAGLAAARLAMAARRPLAAGPDAASTSPGATAANRPPIGSTTAAADPGDAQIATAHAAKHQVPAAGDADSAELARLTEAKPADAPPEGWRALARRYRDFPLLNTPHAFLGALQDTVALALIASVCGPAAAGFWGLAMRYLKAPATLVGSAVSQALYPHLADAPAHAGAASAAGRASVVRVTGLLTLLAAPLVIGLWWLGPWAFERAFGPDWREAGSLSRALALYIGAHFVASPLGVVTMAWGAQRWALRLALVGQVLFVAALGLGLAWGVSLGESGLMRAGWAVSVAMAGYFGYYCWRLAHWPVAGQHDMA